MKKGQRSKVKPARNGWQPPPTSSLHGLHSTTFGSFLRQQRVARGLSRQLLASLTGVEEGTLEKIELNQAVPSYQDIKNLAPVLEVPEQALMEVAGYVKRGNGEVPTRRRRTRARRRGGLAVVALPDEPR